MTRTKRSALYEIGVTYSPPEGEDLRLGDSGHGHITLTSPRSDAWYAAWEQATRIERVRYCTWFANVTCRAWVELVGQMVEETGLPLALVNAAYNMANTVKVTDEDDTGYISFSVEHDEAKKWVARIKSLINEVIAADAAVLALTAPDQEHAGPVPLQTPATTAAEERAR